MSDNNITTHERAEKEIQFLSERTKEGQREAIINGKKIVKLMIMITKNVHMKKFGIISYLILVNMMNQDMII